MIMLLQRYSGNCSSHTSGYTLLFIEKNEKHFISFHVFVQFIATGNGIMLNALIGSTEQQIIVDVLFSLFSSICFVFFSFHSTRTVLFDSISFFITFYCNSQMNSIKKALQNLFFSNYFFCFSPGTIISLL